VQSHRKKRNQLLLEVYSGLNQVLYRLKYLDLERKRRISKRLLLDDLANSLSQKRQRESQR